MAPQRKDPADRKTLTIRIRVTEEQRRVLQAAADKLDFELSFWLRRLALEEATRINERGARRTREK
ncbi:MAG TPA: hypothetical protein VKZ18_24770 [Polyangia bacterium]|nr:hypothetical protein [Polyangia bacterium]